MTSQALKKATLADCDRIDVIADTAIAENRDLTPQEAAEVAVLVASIEASKSSPENSMQAPATAQFRTVPPNRAPAVHTNGPRNYSLLNLVRHAIDPTFDAGFEIEVARELRNRAPWMEGQKGFEGGMYVPLGAVLGVPKASATNPGDNMEPLLGTDYRDELTRIDGAITRATITDKIGARVLTGLVERTVQFPRQLGQMTAGHVAIDANLPAATDPTFDNVTLTPKLCGSIATLNLSAVFAQHPQAGTPQWISAELQRALTVEVNRAVLSGNNSVNGEEPDGLVSWATTASTTPIRVSTDSIADLNNLKAELRTYLQVDDDMLQRVHFIHHPRFSAALESVPSFTGSGMSVASDINSGAAARMRYAEAEILPVTPGTPDSAPGYLIGDPQYIIHGLWEAMSITINPFADSVFAAGGTLVRIMLMHDFLVIDPKRVLATATHLDASP